MQRALLNLAILGVPALAVSALATPGHAQDAPPPPASGAGRPVDTVTVGVGVAMTTDYDGGRDYRIIPGGALRGTVRGHDFQLNGLQLFVDAIPNDSSRLIDVEFGPAAGVRLNRTGDVDDARVEALGELDVAVELGARGAVGVRRVFNRTDKLALAVTGVWDVAGAHRSHVITPALEYTTLAGRRMFLKLAVTTEFVGGDYADYYFGVSPAGAIAAGLPAHAPDGGFASVGGSILGNYALGDGRKGWSLFGIASYKRLQGDIADSPLVRDIGSPNQVFVSFGIGYTF